MKKLALAGAVLVAAGSIAYVAWPSSGKSPVTFIPHARSVPMTAEERRINSPLAWCVYRRGTGRFAVLVQGSKDCPSHLPPSQVVNWRQRCDRREAFRQAPPPPVPLLFTAATVADHPSS